MDEDEFTKNIRLMRPEYLDRPLMDDHIVEEEDNFFNIDLGKVNFYNPNLLPQEKELKDKLKNFFNFCLLFFNSILGFCLILSFISENYVLSAITFSVIMLVNVQDIDQLKKNQTVLLREKASTKELDKMKETLQWSTLKNDLILAPFLLFSSFADFFLELFKK